MENFADEIHQTPDRRPESTKLKYSSRFVISPDDI